MSSIQEQASEKRKFLPAVSTSLALAAGIGLMEMVALIVGSGTLMDIVGIPVVRKTNLLLYLDFLDLELLRCGIWMIQLRIEYSLVFVIPNAYLKCQNYFLDLCSCFLSHMLDC